MIEEQLKNNLKQWIYFTPEERAVYETASQADARNVIRLNFSTGKFMANDSSTFYNSNIYQLAPDYQPEPEVPVMEGLMFLRVIDDGRRFIRTDGIAEPITHVIVFGCYGYWYDEFQMLSTSPFLYKVGNSFRTTITPSTTNFSILAPQWVAFREAK